MDKHNSVTGGAGHPDPYAYLFEFQPADRPALSERETLAKIALLKSNQPDRYEKLIGVLKEKRVPRVRELEQDVSRTLRKLMAMRRERKAEQHEDHDDGFERDAKSGAVLPTQGNIRLAIEKLGVTLSFDAFARRPIIEGLDGFGPTLDDNAETRLWLEIDERFRFRARKDFFHAVVFDICLTNQFHPVRDYLDGLTWDGTARLDTWLSDYCGVEDTPYTRAVGRITLIAAVRRVRQPGCKFDEMLVLESPEGFNKSTMLAEMAVSEEWFSDSLPLNVDDKRMIENASGKWIIENAELQGMRKGDVGVIKAQLSRRRDRARLAYDRMPSEVDRQCIFIGTVNPAEATGYLASLTGNRRFWPVEVKRIDLEAFKADRDQLWAEASAREAQGESIRLDPALWDAAVEQQKKREAPNPLYDKLLPYLGHLNGMIFAADVWELLAIPVTQRQPQYEKMGKAMVQLGARRVERRRVRGGKKEGAYVLGAETHRLVVDRDLLDRTVVVRAEPIAEGTTEDGTTEAETETW